MTNSARSRASVVVPPRVFPTLDKVQVVGSNLATIAAGTKQASMTDVLNAIQELSNKVGQVSKNQQILETKLEQIQKQVGAIDSNQITLGNYLQGWFYTLQFNLGVDKGTYITDAPGMPHWK